MYLWHWPLIALERVTHAGPVPFDVLILIYATATILAWLGYRFVERPFRKPQARTPGYKLVIAGLAAAAALAFASVTLGNALSRVPPPSDLASRTANDFPANRFLCNYREVQALNDFPRSGCNSVEGMPVRVVIWGDSYAFAWQPFAWTLAQHQSVAATSYSRDGCPPVLECPSCYNYLEEQRCIDFNKMVFDRLRSIDTLIIAARWPDPSTHHDLYKKFAATIDQVGSSVEKNHNSRIHALHARFCPAIRQIT